MQLRASALRSALRKAAPAPREAFEAPRGRLGRGLRDRRLAPGALAEAAVADASTGGCSQGGPLGFRVKNLLESYACACRLGDVGHSGMVLAALVSRRGTGALGTSPVAGQGFHKSCTACAFLLWRCGVGAWGCVRCFHELQIHDAWSIAGLSASLSGPGLGPQDARVCGGHGFGCANSTLTLPMPWHAERSQPSTPMLEATSKAQPPAHASAVFSALLYVEAVQGASQGLCCSCRQHRACLLARAS